jgi:hypothetical protein
MMGRIYCEVVSKEGVNTIPETARKSKICGMSSTLHCYLETSN